MNRAASVAVLSGAGTMDVRVARTLATFDEVSKLLAADVDPRSAAALAAKLGAASKGQVGAQQPDVTDAARLRGLFEQFRMVVHCRPAVSAIDELVCTDGRCASE